MKRMNGRLICVLVCLVMAMSMVPGSVFAETSAIVASGDCGTQVHWTFYEDGTMEIYGVGPMDDYYPESSDPSPWDDHQHEIKKAVIRDGVTSIGEYVFRYCDNMTSVEIPDSVTQIGMSGFAVCKSLTDITLPEKLTFIGGGAFQFCEGLTRIVIPESVTEIGDMAFADCTGLTSITLPSGVTGIGRYWFKNCTSLAAITIPDGVTSIGEYAFSHCESLANVTIPQAVVSIGDKAFGNAGLEEITFLGSAPSIAENAFYETEATVRYPCSDASWTEQVQTGLGGTLTWEAVHRYEEIVIPPTCSEEGVTADVCEDCGYRWVKETAEATGHEYGGWVMDDTPTCTQPATLTRVCLHCDDCETSTIVLSHKYEDGICTRCGEADPDAVKDPGLKLSYPTLSFEDEVIYNVYFSAADTSSVVEMGLMILPGMDQTATIADADALVPGYVTNGTICLTSSQGIPAANLGDTLYFKVYAKLTDGSYAYSDAGGYNAKAYASAILEGEYPAEMKALVVSMLNYGAEAQLFFGHNTGSLVNDALTDDQKALVSAYDSTMMDAIVKADSTKTSGFVRVDTNFDSLYPSVSFDGAFAINFYCAPAIGVDSGMTLYYWDMETMASVDKLSISNAAGSMEMTAANGTYWGQVTGIAAKEMDKTYYVTCVFESDGQTITTGIIPYSLGKYCADKAGTDGDAQQSFAQATAGYGYYAKRYFSTVA